MATSFKMATTNSRGLGRAIFFDGLAKPMVLAPCLVDEPLLTAQAAYFLSRQECLAKVRFDDREMVRLKEPQAVDNYLETLTDNYLFAFSRRHPELRITGKVQEFVFLPDMTDAMHFGYDYHLVECLALDAPNDKSIVRLSESDASDFVLVKNYIDEARQIYESAVAQAMKRFVIVETVDHEVLGTGSHKLPIAILHEKPLTFEQMASLEVIRPGETGREPDRYFVTRGTGDGFYLPKEEITTTQYYDHQLLAYYFCALRDGSPSVRFKNFYNVLEFFFEDCANHAGTTLTTELKGLEFTLAELLQPSEIIALYASQSERWRQRVTTPQRTSSGVVIGVMDLDSSSPLTECAKRIYAIRNACVHSKKTRKGRIEPRFVPSRAEEVGIEDEVPLMQEIAARCIERFGMVDNPLV